MIILIPNGNLLVDIVRAFAVFTRVVESGSFSAAAKDLALGQPAISKMMLALENHLGVRLLNRSTRRLTVTEAGQALYERAIEVLSIVEEAEVAARGINSGLQGVLRVSVPVTFGRLHVVPRLSQFLDAHPNLQIELIMDDRNVDLLAEKIDIALRAGALADSSLIAKRVASTERVVVAAPAYLAKHGIPQSPAELLQHNVIIYDQNNLTTNWLFKQGTKETSVKVQGRLHVTSAEGLREAVLAGLGLAIVSRWMMSQELLDNKVVTVLDEWQLPGVTLWAVHASGRMVSTKISTFLTWFSQAFNEQTE